MSTAGHKSDLFRESAVKAAQYRWFSPVPVITPSFALPTCVFAALAVASLGVAAVVIEVPDRVRATGVLLPSAGLLKVRAFRAGRVEKLRIANGEHVLPGQALMRLVSAERSPRNEPESAEQLASLKRELQLLHSSLEQELVKVESRRRSNRLRKELLERRLQAANVEQHARQRQAQVQQTRARRASLLAKDGLVAAQIADDLTATALQTQALVEGARQQVLALQDEIARLDEQFEQDSAMPGSLRTQVSIRKEALLREIATVEVRSAVIVTAPGVGVVAGLQVRAGSFVQAGQVMLTLYDATEPLEARLYVSANNAAMIRVGQRVELQLRAFPHQLFGTQSAVVTKVSVAAPPSREIDVLMSSSGPVFEVRAALESTSILARGDIWKLPPGTAFDAHLVRRRWPLYRWLWRSGQARDRSRA